MEVNNGNFRVLATGGDNQLGGEDLVCRLMTYVQKQSNVEVARGTELWVKFRAACEDAKVALSAEKEVLCDDHVFSCFDRSCVGNHRN